MKRILTLILLAVAFMQANASYVTYGQIGVEQGLSSNSIKTMARDRFGRIWVGTANGVNLISNGKIRQFQSFQINDNCIIVGDVLSIACANRLVIATTDRIFDFDPEIDSTRIVTWDGRSIRTEFILLKDNTVIFFNAAHNAVMKYDLESCSTEIIVEFPAERQYHFTKIMQTDDPDRLLLAENERGIFSLNLKDGRLTNLEQIGGNINARASFIDKKNILWVAYPDKGISGYYLNSVFDRIASYDEKNSGLNGSDISCMAETPDENLIVCTYRNGSFILNRRTGTVQNELLQGEALSHVTCIEVNTHEKDILFGTTFNGIINWRSTFFRPIFASEDKDRLSTIKIPISAYQDNDGCIWFGNGGAGLYKYDEDTKKLTKYPSTDGMGISAIANFNESTLLICDKANGLMYLNKSTGNVSAASFLSDAGLSVSPSRLSNLKLANTPDNDILLLNCNGRHLIYRQSSGDIQEIQLQKNGEENNNVIEDIAIMDSHATIACGECIYELDYRTLMARLIYQDNDNPENTIRNVVEDSKGLVWACTSKHVFSYDPRSGKISQTMNGIDGVFMSMAIDHQDELWLSTDKSLLMMYDLKDLEKKEPYIYSGRECSSNYNFLPLFTLISKKGLVYFPNTSGLIIVDPLDKSRPTGSRIEELNLIRITVDGKNVEDIDSHSSDTHIDVPNRFSQIEVSLAIGHFNQTKRIPLKYTLLRKGNTKPVIEKVTGETVITIPRMSFGTYSLLVSQRTLQGWSEPVQIMSYEVARPFIMTIPAYLIILALILAISITISKVSISLKQIDMDKAMNLQENKHKDDRISLLSNLAHELKTPLSLIYNPVKDMLEEKAVSGIDYERLERIFNQVQKMSEMVNMILNKGTADISKSDISIERTDLNGWLGQIIEDFKIDCYGKGLKTQFIPQNDLGMVDMDVKMVEVAVNNIMTNAIKYSDSGTITITTEKSDGMVRISFQDEGRGFTCKPEELFKRYYREDDNQPGYGLGLSYAKLLINILEGTIKARKNKGPGSTFTIEFPDDLRTRFSVVAATPKMAPAVAAKPQLTEIEEPAPSAEEVDFDTKSTTLLIVDDQDDILQFIKNEYTPLFKTIYTAHDGSEALDLIRQRMPNVVVSDIMMPRMNGFELCKTIKTDLELSSIPVILLTSRSDPKNQDMGYKMGADSFMPKPFDSKLLYKIIRSQLKNRYEIKRQYATSFFTAISEDQTFSAADEQFVLKLNRFIRENLADTMLGVDMIIEHMHVSRTTLFNKMNSLVGASTNKYIRRIRIEVAKEMLSKTNKSVGTIAEETGFSESQYFSTVFKQETGMTPSQFKDSLRK